MSAYIMERVQKEYSLSERLLRSLSGWKTFGHYSDTVERCLRDGADPNKRHGTHLPVHCACMASNLDGLRLLLDAGGNVNSRDGYGFTPLHYAAQYSFECVEILLDSGAAIDSRDNNGSTPLQWAVFKNDVDSTLTLLERGANACLTDANGDTPAHWAARKANAACLELLIDFNCPIDAANGCGDTPLTRACRLYATGLATDDAMTCIDMLLAASAQPALDNATCLRHPLIARDAHLTAYLHARLSHPASLLHFARYAVRSALPHRGVYIPDLVPELPISTRLQDYLIFKHN